MPKCKNCLTKFEVKFFNQKYCLINDDCRNEATKFAIEQKEKNFKKDRVKDTKQRKEALLTHSEWLKLLQVVFNTYIRERDKKAGYGCISCGTKKNIQYAAGHYFTVGGFPSVRFDEDNLHLQCNNFCNMQLSGNIINYRPALIERIGLERFEALEYRARNGVLKLSIPEIKEKIIYYKAKIKELK